MELLKYFAALSVFASVALYTHAAPHSDLFGPSRTLSDDIDMNRPHPLIDESLRETTLQLDSENEVQVDEEERFHRVYADGTVEFKTALSNGHVQYQRISNKVLADGKTIQLYEGYVSQRYADGRYGTTYYVADENGYRRTKVEVSMNPPVLPITKQDLESITRVLAPVHIKKSNRGGTKYISHSELPVTESSYANTARPYVPTVTTLPIEEEQVVSITEGVYSAYVKPVEGESRASTNIEADTISSVAETTSEFKTSDDDNLIREGELIEKDSSVSSPVESHPQVAPTEGIEIKGSTEAPIVNNEEKIASDVEEASGHSPTTEEVATKIFEDTTRAISSVPETPTDATVEENEIKSDDKVTTPDETTTDLPASIDDKDLEPITGIPDESSNSSESAHENDESSEVTTLPTYKDHAEHSVDEVKSESSTEEDETSTEVPTTQENVFKISKDNAVKSEEPTNHSDEEKTTEIPIIAVPVVEEDSSRISEDDATKTESITELAIEANASQASTEVPAVPVIREDSSNVSEDESGKDESITEVSIEEKSSEASTEVHALTTNEEDSSNATKNEESTEHTVEENIHEASTDVPALPTNEEDSSIATKNEESTEHPMEEKIHEASTGLPMSEDEAVKNESITELPAQEKTLEKATEIPLLPAIEEGSSNISKNEDSNNESITELSVEEKSNEASTEIPELSEVEKDSSRISEESTGHPVEDKTYDSELPLKAKENSSNNSEDDRSRIQPITELPVEEDDSEASKDVPAPLLPGGEDNSSSVSTNDAAKIESSTDLPSEESISAASSEEPALPVTESILKISEENSVKSEEITEHSYSDKTIEPSTEVPASPVTENIITKVSEEDTVKAELPTEDAYSEYNHHHHHHHHDVHTGTDDLVLSADNATPDLKEDGHNLLGQNNYLPISDNTDAEIPSSFYPGQAVSTSEHPALSSTEEYNASTEENKVKTAANDSAEVEATTSVVIA